MCTALLCKRKLPHQLCQNSFSVFDPGLDSMKVTTLQSARGWSFRWWRWWAQRMPANGEDER